MQLLSLAALGPEARQLFDDFAQNPPPAGADLVILGALALGLAVLSCWVASQLMFKEKAGVGKAIQAALLGSMACAVISFLTGGALYASLLQGSETMTKVSLAIGAVIFLYAAVSIPMKIFGVRVVPALGFAMAALILETAAIMAAVRITSDRAGFGRRTMLLRSLAALPADQRSECVRTIRQALTIIQAPPAEPTIEQRQAELTSIYNDLLARRETLEPGDYAGLEAYTRDQEHYIQRLEQLQKDAAADKKIATESD